MQLVAQSEKGGEVKKIYNLIKYSIVYKLLNRAALSLVLHNEIKDRIERVGIDMLDTRDLSECYSLISLLKMPISTLESYFMMQISDEVFDYYANVVRLEMQEDLKRDDFFLKLSVHELSEVFRNRLKKKIILIYDTRYIDCDRYEYELRERWKQNKDLERFFS